MAQVAGHERVLLGAGACAARVLAVGAPVPAGSNQRRGELEAGFVGQRRQAGFHLAPSVSIANQIANTGEVKRAEGKEVVMENTPPCPARSMHTVSCTENLGTRRGELVRLQNRRDRIQECVLRKVRLGMSYDEAWESAKREHQEWFEQDK